MYGEPQILLLEIQMNEVKKIIESSHYQTFDFLGDRKRDSDSGKKYELSKLDEYNLNEKSCLDIGCNAGYFLFRLIDKNPKTLVGIDLGQKFIDIANNLNNDYFKCNIIKFICGDFFSYNFETRFDLIICFSTFHYFDDKQKDFTDQCFILLNVKGTLLLEVEEFPENLTSKICNNPRPADGRNYNYPNELKMKEFVSGKFNIGDKYISTKQEGSLYDRYFYRLEKI